MFNLVHHPDFLTVAWERVRGNKGARTAGVDRVSPASIAEDGEVVEFLGQAAGAAEGPHVCAAAGAGTNDPQTGQQASFAGSASRPRWTGWFRRP